MHEDSKMLLKSETDLPVALYCLCMHHSYYCSTGTMGRALGVKPGYPLCVTRGVHRIVSSSE